jgi:hypothetical protein
MVSLLPGTSDFGYLFTIGCIRRSRRYDGWFVRPNDVIVSHYLLALMKFLAGILKLETALRFLMLDP